MIPQVCHHFAELETSSVKTVYHYNSRQVFPGPFDMNLVYVVLRILIIINVDILDGVLRLLYAIYLEDLVLQFVKLGI